MGACRDVHPDGRLESEDGNKQNQISGPVVPLRLFLLRLGPLVLVIDPPIAITSTSEAAYTLNRKWHTSPSCIT